MQTRAATAVMTALFLAGCAATTPRPRFAAKSPADEDAAEAATPPPLRALASEPEAQASGPSDAPPLPTPVPPEPTPALPASELLAAPLSVDTAVRAALLRNPSLQASFEEAGISQADLARAARVANPELSGFVRFPRHGPGLNTELSIVQDLFDVLLQPLRRKLAAAELEQTKLRIADQALALAAEVKQAFFTLQARRQLVSRLNLVRDLTGAAADFAREQRAAGTINELELESRSVLFRESKVEVALAEAEVRADRERLNRLLGLWGPETGWSVAAELPEIPDAPIPLEGLERLAMERRQDLRAARWGVDLVGRALALRRKTRFFPIGVQAGLSTEKDVTGARVTGPQLALQLPLFDTGRASIARLEAEHRRAERQLEALAVNARSEVREERDRMLAARDLALYYRRVLLPQRLRILELTLGQYNAMFKGAYDLLSAKQAEVETEKAYLEAWRDYWIAGAKLERALGGPLPAQAEAAAEAGREGR